VYSKLIDRTKGWSWAHPRHFRPVRFPCARLSIVECEPGSALSRIEDNAFAQCGELTFPPLPIGEGAFLGCPKLCTVVLESFSKLARIVAGAFAERSLQSICLLSVRVLPEACFATPKGLVTVTCESESRLSRIENSGFTNGPSLSALAVPASVESLRQDCFSRCDALRVIKLSRFDESVFSGCRQVTMPCIPRQIRLFPVCLTSIDLYPGVNCVNSQIMFRRMRQALNSLFGESAFRECCPLQSI
jgi:hypothetical protein